MQGRSHLRRVADRHEHGDEPSTGILNLRGVLPSALSPDKAALELASTSASTSTPVSSSPSSSATISPWAPIVAALISPSSPSSSSSVVIAVTHREIVVSDWAIVEGGDHDCPTSSTLNLNYCLVQAAESILSESMLNELTLQGKGWGCRGSKSPDAEEQCEEKAGEAT